MYSLDKRELSRAHIEFLKEAAPLISLGSRDFQELAKGDAWSSFAAAYNIDRDFMWFLPRLSELGSLRSNEPIIYRQEKLMKNPKHERGISFKIRYVAMQETPEKIGGAEDIEKITRGCVEWGGIGCLAYHHQSLRCWMEGNTLYTIARETLGSQLPRPLVEVKLKTRVKTLVDIQEALSIAWDEVKGLQQEPAMWKGVYVKPSASSAIAAADMATSCRLYAEQTEKFGINVIPVFYYATRHYQYKMSTLENAKIPPGVMPLWYTWGDVLGAISRQRGVEAALVAIDTAPRYDLYSIRAFNRVACMVVHQHMMNTKSGQGGPTMHLVELAAARLAAGLMINIPASGRSDLLEVLVRVGDQLHRIDVEEAITVFKANNKDSTRIYSRVQEIAVKYLMVMNNSYLSTCRRYTRECYYPADLVTKLAQEWQEVKDSTVDSSRGRRAEEQT
jgi:hypothetical protein